jgi:two-component system OmpR family sensor kinase
VTTSLRARLFLGLTGFVLITGLAAGLWAFHWAYDEAIEFQDSLLMQVGTLAVRTHIQVEDPVLNGVDKEAQVVIEYLGPGSAAAPGILTSAGLSADAPDGLQTVTQGAESWRILLQTRNDGSRVAIGQSNDYRDEIAHGSAIRTVIPLAVLFPCLMLLVGAVIRTSFRPVSQLAAELDTKRTDHLQRLPIDGMPNELLPFIESINRLLDRIGAMFDQQRRFVADAAHELRTPITALSLQIENLEHGDLPPDTRERINSLKDGARRSRRLLEQLLALARFEANTELTPPITRLDHVSRDVVSETLQRVSARNIDLGFERCDPVAVRADAASLAALVRNLVENAVRYTPDNGRIDLVIGEDGDQALFQVSDSGPGIDKADMPRIFEPFFRSARAVGEGTGLGLSIVERICKRLSGTVAVENIGKQAKPAGLRVTVRMPKSAKTKTTEPAATLSLS